MIGTLVVHDLYKEAYMSIHVHFLMRLAEHFIVVFFSTSLLKFNNTRTLMLDSIHHTSTVLWSCICPA